MKNEAQDMFGNILLSGDFVVYATSRWGSSALHVGIIVGTGTRESWRSKTSDPTLRVIGAQLHRYDETWELLGGTIDPNREFRVVTVGCLDRVSLVSSYYLPADLRELLEKKKREWEEKRVERAES